MGQQETTQEFIERIKAEKTKKESQANAEKAKKEPQTTTTATKNNEPIPLPDQVSQKSKTKKPPSKPPTTQPQRRVFKRTTTRIAIGTPTWVALFLVMTVSGLSALAIIKLTAFNNTSIAKPQASFPVEVITLRQSDQIIRVDNSPQPDYPETTPPNPPPTDQQLGDIGIRNFGWRFAGRDFQVSIVIDRNIITKYQPISYKGDEAAFYQKHLELIDGDDGVKQLAEQLLRKADSSGFNRNQLVELAMSFVQTAIKYDQAKAVNNRQAYRPYELLNIKQGVCIDKALLAKALLNELGFGNCLILMPDINHAAIGIDSPIGLGVDGSNWSYLETTAELKIGELPLYKNGRLGPEIIRDGNSQKAKLGRLNFILPQNGEAWVKDQAL